MMISEIIMIFDNFLLQFFQIFSRLKMRDIKYFFLRIASISVLQNSKCKNCLRLGKIVDEK